MMFSGKFKILKKTPQREPVRIGENEADDLKVLLEECRLHLKSVNEDIIRKAFYMCVDAHRDHLRKSGEPYYVHPLEVSRIVAKEITLDDTSVASALLHDVLNYSDKYTLNDIKSEFGGTIATIVDGVHKIKNIESYNLEQLNQLENYRKLLLSLFKDVRIILIKLADRLHNMRTLEYIPRERQLHIANETQEVYIPFANRFGLRNLKWELEDLSFKYLNRHEYDQISSQISGTRKEREEYVKNFIEPINEKLKKDEFLKKNNIKFEINGRAKHIFSIYNKMRIREKSLDELYDLFAIRIILDTNDNNICFYVYGIIASIYKPVPSTFKDYISDPKNNGYQSIHTAVLGPDSKPVEVQIRTLEMHKISEQGFAAHFKYKRGLLPAQSVLENLEIQHWLDSVRKIFESKGEDDPQTLLESVKKNLYQEEIYVFTPKNELRIFPAGATPLDFAFDIHSQVGHQCIGAKVNGKIAPLDYKMKSGDVLEILTSQNQKPDPHWLNLVITSKAKNAINKYLKQEQKDLEEKGRRIWDELLESRKLTVGEDVMYKLAASLKIMDLTDFYKKLAKNEIDINKTFDLLYFKVKGDVKDYVPQNGNGKKEDWNKVKSLVNLKYKFADCCNPNQGDLIKGIVDADIKTVTIHRADCPLIIGLMNSKFANIIEPDWKEVLGKSFGATIRILADDRNNLILEIADLIINTEGIEINGITYDVTEGDFEANIDINANNKEKLEKLFENLSKASAIKSIERIAS